MKKTLLITLMITALLGVFTASMVSAADAPADGLEMKYPADGAKYAPIMFNHSTHTALKCKKKPDGYYQAFHSKANGSCIGCHKASKKGPDKCNDCHTKK